MRHALLLSSVLFVAPTWLCAQTATAPAEDQPHVLIDTVGPDGWRIRLGPTNLGSLLESEKGRELWEPHLEPYFDMWHKLAGDQEAFAASQKRLLAYGGRIRVGLWFEPNPRRGNDPAACVAIVLDGDGRTDLSAISEELRATLYQTIPGEWDEVDIDGTKCTVRRSGDSSLTAPLLEDGKVIIAATDEGALELALRRTRALAKAPIAPIKPNSPALRIDFDFATIFSAFMENEPESDRAAMRVIGLESIGTGTAKIGTAGPRIQFEYSQAFTSDDRGLFGAMLPSTRTVPSLLRAVGEGTWTVGHFDCLQFYETVVDALAESDLTGGDPRAEIKQELGIDPATDLLNHMTDNAMLWLPEAENFDDGLDKTPWVITFSLSDEKAFREGLFKTLPQWRPFLQRERKEVHEDIELYRYGNMFSYDIWLAIGHGVFTFAGGRGAEDRIIEALDRCKNLPAELPDNQKVPEGFEQLERFLPPGCHGYAVGSATNIISLPSSTWLVFLDIFTPFPGVGISDPDEDVERREALNELLRDHGLDIARSATGYDQRTWHWRMYW